MFENGTRRKRIRARYWIRTIQFKAINKLTIFFPKVLINLLGLNRCVYSNCSQLTWWARKNKK